MTVIFYGYRRCRTSNAVERAYRAAGLGYVFIDVTREPPRAEILGRLVERYGPAGVVRRRRREALEAYRERGLEGLLELVRSDPKILLRPVVVRGGEALAGADARTLLPGA